MPPTIMPVMSPMPNLRLNFVYLGFWNSRSVGNEAKWFIKADVGVDRLGSIGVEAKGLIKADFDVDRREKEATLSQFSPTASRFLAVVVGLLCQNVNCFMSTLIS